MTQEPTPTPDDEIAVIARALCDLPDTCTLHREKAARIHAALKSAGYELVNQVGTMRSPLRSVVDLDGSLMGQVVTAPMCTCAHRAYMHLQGTGACVSTTEGQSGMHRGQCGCDEFEAATPTPNAELVELTARWIGERESTHTWPEIREDDKACYRDAAGHLLATINGSDSCPRS